MSIQKKVALLFLVLTVSVILIFSSAIFYFVHQFTFDDFYKRLETRVNISSQIHHLNDRDSLGMYREIRQRYLERLIAEKQYIIKPDIYTKGKTVKGVPRQLINNIIANGKSRFKADNVFYAGNIFHFPEGDAIIVVSATNPSGLSELNDLEQVLIISFLISILIVYIIGRRFSYHTFKPVRSIIKKVNTITASNLHLRLEDYNGKDEIAELTQTFNNMLDRLETAFETQNNFISNASHELRTPLAIIKGEAELSLKNIDTPGADLHKNLQEILTGTQSLQDIITSLLGLAQSGFDGKKQNWEQIRADEMAFMVKEAVDHIIPANNLSIDFSSLPDDVDSLVTEGNINLLKLAISNIGLNACKYSENKPVVLKVYAENNSIIFSVKDQGIGIPESDVQHIFEPFFRASNTGKYEGHGVGLPLALNIVRLHKGNIGIVSKEGEGTEIRVMLPIYKGEKS
ncbi:HAMP domain-containing sensor histidine kinase [Mucilaginibacter sp. SJ]|uniref:HAMP domain-containing sensor histidine kinase n=1 Tax=Mucilaginibacter sp. SJ TaxID=3029053 RepID=UPI0023A9E279|nr:HAMP domain-containing sensor histidine kinase [Mucilaginibacter sp. SJ]WDZ99724.1 HAMP domain-containing sensor histidine kinase [Mucilaginibacter sp. SJ]